MLFDNNRCIVYYEENVGNYGIMLKKRIKERCKRLLNLNTNLQQLSTNTETIIDNIKTEYKKLGNISSHHFACIALGNPSVLNDWLSFYRDTVFENNSTKENSYLIIKSIMAFKEYMSVDQLSQLINWWYEHCTPGSALLMNYYLPDIIPKKMMKRVNYYICEFEHNADKIDEIILDFENYARDFLIEYRALLNNNKR